MKAVYGLELTTAEQAIFTHHTGRPYDPPQGGWPEIVMILGRQSGKTRIAAAIAAYESVTAPPATDTKTRTSLLVAQDQRAGLRVALEYAREPFETVPAFASLVQNPKAESVILKSGLHISAYPCSPPAVRGLRSQIVCLDELAHYRNSEGNPVDKAMLRAVRPTLATTKGKLIILSSPSAQSGSLYELHRRHFGNAESSTLVWVATAPEMNPTLDPDYLQRMQLDDPAAYLAEVLGQFRPGESTFLQPAWVDAVTVKGRLFLPPTSGRRYLATVDSSSLLGDSFALSICHPEPTTGKVIQDLVQAWPPPKDGEPPDLNRVVLEIKDVLTRYGLKRVTGDRYSYSWVVQRFKDAGIDYRLPMIPEKKIGADRWSSPVTDDIYMTKSRAYLESLPLFSQRLCELLDNPTLTHQFKSLERHARHGSDDEVTHPPGGHDDLANATALSLALLGQHAVKPAAGPAGITVLGEAGGAIGEAIRPAAGTPGNGQVGYVEQGRVGGQAAQLGRPFGKWGR